MAVLAGQAPTRVERGKSVCVVGAGIVGVSSAYFLRLAGWDVTVVERRKGPGRETSFQNGAMICPAVIRPWTTPKFFSTILKSFVDPESPTRLSLTAMMDPALWRWSMYFYKSCKDETKAVENYRTLFALGMYSVGCFKSILKDVPSYNHEATAKGTLIYCSGREELEEMAAQFSPVKNIGCSVDVRLGKDAVEKEPALAAVKGGMYGAIFLDDDSSGSIHLFTEKLHDKCKEMGVKFVFGKTVASMSLSDDKSSVQSLALDSGEEICADEFVVCSGSFSTKLVQMAHAYVPVYPVKVGNVAATENLCTYLIDAVIFNRDILPWLMFLLGLKTLPIP